MTCVPDWLPQLFRLTDAGDYWEKYLAELYGVFYRDFRMSKPYYNNRPVTIDRHLLDGKERAFWHIISTENKESGDRIPDLRRCERVGWVRAIIEHANEECVSVWQNKRKTHQRILLWLEKLDYLIVLDERAGALSLVTAYCTDFDRTQRKLRKDREKYRKKQAPPLPDDASTPPTHGR